MKTNFSIIIPVFNGDKTLKRALDSIRIQSFKDYEIIIIDGKSTDNSLAIINDFMYTNTSIKVKFISEKDNGIYDAMNKGIELSSHNYLYFMGCDDELYAENTLENLGELNDIELVYGNVIGKLSGTNYASNSREEVLIKGIHHQGIFYHKRVFEIIGNYDLRFKIASDYHLTLKVFLNDYFNKKYIDFPIAKFGEEGLSSKNYDYLFYSYHYRLLNSKINMTAFQSSNGCLKKSIYCCHFLAMHKKSITFAWKNLAYYFFTANELAIKDRLAMVANMLYWTIKPLKLIN